MTAPITDRDALAERSRTAFRLQAEYCHNNGAPITGRICAGLADALDQASATGRRVLAWAQPPIPDALPLRLTGGVHALYLAGRLPELDRLFDGSLTDAEHIAALLSDVLVREDHALLPWLDGPPQTNEAGRSACLVAGFAWLTARGHDRFEVLEIGSSAGLNLLIDRYRYDLGGVAIGPPASPVLIRPDWQGPPPPLAPFGFAGLRGVDLQPIDLTDPAAAERLRAYVWHDNRERFERLEAGIAMICEAPVRIDQGDAVDWLAERLAEPQAAGVTRVLMHSVMWQYLPATSQAAITGMMETAGAKADAERPLAWVQLEADRGINRHELTVRHWPGDTGAVTLASAHPHGAWVRWQG